MLMMVWHNGKVREWSAIVTLYSLYNVQICYIHCCIFWWHVVISARVQYYDNFVGNIFEYCMTICYIILYKGKAWEANTFVWYYVRTHDNFVGNIFQYCMTMCYIILYKGKAWEANTLVWYYVRTQCKKTYIYMIYIYVMRLCTNTVRMTWIDTKIRCVRRIYHFAGGEYHVMEWLRLVGSLKW